MILKKVLLVVFFFIEVNSSNGQLFNAKSTYSTSDSLRGALTPVRTCYDVFYYHLDIRLDTAERSIEGFNKIYFTITEPTKLIQVDLFENMEVRKILLDDSIPVDFHRSFNAIFINLQKFLAKGSKHRLTVFYGGKPIIGKRLPWDGGFNWTKDKDGLPWIGVACQGTGASLWWPNKDHQSDEPDSMLISVSVPKNLQNISNGRLRLVKELRGGYKRYDWFVSNPINNYNVTLNVGNYAHLSDYYIQDKDTLTLDYFVLPENVEKAKTHFLQVNPMFSCFEKYFGKYPFISDGFKLVETSYLGMEHQSAIAYGNRYKTGYNGIDYSGIELDFDYVIIHEAAHEWWGNNLTTKDIADMWIHEGFASYAEALYVECMFNYETASRYINKKKGRVSNAKPVIGPYGVNQEGSGDMYAKGMLILNTVRHIINNDSIWFSIIKGLQIDFRLKTITSLQVEQYISSHSGMDLSLIFDQYLRNSSIPELQIKFEDKNNPGKLQCRWSNVIDGFSMPVIIYSDNNKQVRVVPGVSWQNFTLALTDIENLKVADDQFYVVTKILK